MKRVVAIVGFGIAIFAIAGCGSAHTSDRAVLLAGYSMAGEGTSPSPSDAAARRDVRGQVRRWRAELSTYLGPPHSLERAQRRFRARLTAAAARYRFTVKRVDFVHAREALAPLVIVQTRDYTGLSGAISAFLPSLCSGRRGCEPFLEAQDERGVPFVAVGVGQWARSEPLYPFIHG